MQNVRPPAGTNPFSCRSLRLRKKSQIIVDKPQTVPREKIGTTIGRLDPDTLVAVERALAVFLGIA